MSNDPFKTEGLIAILALAAITCVGGMRKFLEHLNVVHNPLALSL